MATLTLSQRLSSFVLSAEEVKQLNPEWSDAMTQDYLDIFRNLAIIAAETDVQIDFGNGLESIIFSNEAMLNRIRTRVNKLLDRPLPVENNGNTRVRLNTQDKRINDIEQLVHSW